MDPGIPLPSAAFTSDLRSEVTTACEGSSRYVADLLSLSENSYTDVCLLPSCHEVIKAGQTLGLIQSKVSGRVRKCCPGCYRRITGKDIASGPIPQGELKLHIFNIASDGYAQFS